MANPLLLVLTRLLSGGPGEARDAVPGSKPSVTPRVPAPETSVGILLVLRRMRVPLIVLIMIFAVSVLGLSLVPGEDAQGRPTRMTLFESFYFMSYTATTIGFGEIPHAFTPLQRMWVTFAIFLSVIGWAYAVGSMLALIQDRAFRLTLARRHFDRKVAHLAEPFLVIVGYGNASKRLARSLDEMGRRFVIVDSQENRVAQVDLDSYHADTPALLGDARDTSKMLLAGLAHRHCEGVVALTGDDETNLDVTMTTALLRPDLLVIARSSSRDVAERMTAFGAALVVNPLDRFGDHLRILLRSPSSFQLMMWLTSAPGTPLPERRSALARGMWVVCGYGRFGREITEDLRAEGLEVTVVEGPGRTEQTAEQIDSATLASAPLGDADAIVAATESDMTNLWIVEKARRHNPDAFVVALQNRAANGALFTALDVDFGMVPAEVIAHEVQARLATPLLMEFLPQVPRQGERWAREVVERLVERCGTGTPDLWRLDLGRLGSPRLRAMLADGRVRLADLMRSPLGREEAVEAVPLLLLRPGERLVTPEDDVVLQHGDELLIAGRRSARRALDMTLVDDATAVYVIEGRHVPHGWLWRKLSRRQHGEKADVDA